MNRSALPLACRVKGLVQMGIRSNALQAYRQSPEW